MSRVAQEASEVHWGMTWQERALQEFHTRLGDLSQFLIVRFHREQVAHWVPEGYETFQEEFRRDCCDEDGQACWHIWTDIGEDTLIAFPLAQRDKALLLKLKWGGR